MSFLPAVQRSSTRLRALGGEAVWALLESHIERARTTHPRASALALHHIARRLCRAHGVEARVQGTFVDQPAILISNHLSYLDPLVITALRECIPIAKSELAEWPVLGGCLSELGVNFVRRGDCTSGAVVLRRAHRALAAGASVLNFPEGTTSTGARVLPFHRGIFGLARMAGVPVLPIALRLAPSDLCWVGGHLFLPHYLKTTTLSSIEVRISVGAPLEPERFASPETLAAAARDAVRELLERT